MGTPSQQTLAQIDTGSSDVWFNTEGSTLCQKTSDPALCGGVGTYNPNASTTWSYLNDQFDISYGDLSGASGDYGTDDVTIGTAKLTSLQIGVAFNSTSAENLMGIGYPSNEIQVQSNNMTAYDNLPVALFKQGFIQSPAYSLWLNNIHNATGSVLFGGVDTAKYRGPLSTVPILPDPDTGMYREFVVNLDAVAVSKDDSSSPVNSGTINPPLPVLLDSGTTRTVLPPNITNNIYSLLSDYNVSYYKAFKDAGCLCSLANSTMTIHFNFSGAIISVPVSLLVSPIPSFVAQDIPPGYCIFEILPLEPELTPSNSSILGDSFLQAAYVVYDLANNEVSIAQTVFNTTDSDIHEILPGKDGVPGASNATVTSLASTVSVAPSSSATAVIPVSSGGGGAVTAKGYPSSVLTALMLGSALAMLAL